MDKEETRKRIGQRVTDLRKDAGLTQKELAERCGLAQNHISRIEGGKYSPGLDLMETVAEALGKHVDLV